MNPKVSIVKFLHTQYSLPYTIDREYWGFLADAVAQEYQQKQPLLRDLRAKLSDPQAWNTLREQLHSRLRTPQQIKEALQAAGAAHCVGDLNCSAERVREALQHQHEIRMRVTVIDLSWSLGLLPQETDEILQTWLL